MPLCFRRMLRAAMPMLFACALRCCAQDVSPAVVHTPEVDLAYESHGTDHGLPPVVAVNGGPGLTHAYMVQNDLWDRVAKGRRVVFYDQRGDGQSKLLDPAASQSLSAQVADLEALRAALKVTRIDLVGDSFGGLLVLAYTLAHPEHVRRLVVSDGLPGWKAIAHPMPVIYPDLDAEEETRLRGLPKGKEAEEYSFRMHMRKCFASPEVAHRYLSGFQEMGFFPAVGDAVEAATRDVDLTPQLGKVQAQTLVLTGRFDVNVAPMTAWQMAKAIPGAEFHVFEHSGHLPSYEEPEAYLAVLTGFLDR